MVQWLRLHAANAGDVGLIPGQGTKIPHVAQCGQNTKRKKNLSCNAFSKINAKKNYTVYSENVSKYSWQVCSYVGRLSDMN